MFPPALPSLQQLGQLDRYSSEFSYKLGEILRGEEYIQHVPNLQGDDLMWLVNYLDEACRPAISPPRTFLLFHHRFWLSSILPVLLSGGVVASSKAYAAPERLSQHRA